jgi:hypothetical protein
VVRRLAEEITRMLGRGTQRDAEACISRVAMIVDRASAISWGFAFVELVTPELASALMPFLFLPQHQPTGFLISGVPIAASFANANAFIPTPSGPMGGQFLLRAAANGGLGASTIDTPDGEFCTYWHQQAGAVETIPRGALPVPAHGASLELGDETRRFLGNLAGKWKPPKVAAAPSAASSLPSGSSTAAPAAETPSGPLIGGMQPIKIGFGNAIKKKPKEEPAMVEIMSKGFVDDNDEVDLVGKDSVLLSRSKSVGSPFADLLSQGRTHCPPNVNQSEGKHTVLSATLPGASAHVTLGRRLHQQVEHQAERAVCATATQGTQRSASRCLRCKRCAGGTSASSITTTGPGVNQQRVRLRRHAQLRYDWQGGVFAVPAPVQVRGDAAQAQRAIRTSQGSHYTS